MCNFPSLCMTPEGENLTHPSHSHSRIASENGYLGEDEDRLAKLEFNFWTGRAEIDDREPIWFKDRHYRQATQYFRDNWKVLAEQLDPQEYQGSYDVFPIQNHMTLPVLCPCKDPDTCEYRGEEPYPYLCPRRYRCPSPYPCPCPFYHKYQAAWISAWTEQFKPEW